MKTTVAARTQAGRGDAARSSRASGERQGASSVPRRTGRGALRTSIFQRGDAGQGLVGDVFERGPAARRDVLILSRTPAFLTAATESPPPTIETAGGGHGLGDADRALANSSISKMPIGPFQKIVWPWK